MTSKRKNENTVGDFKGMWWTNFTLTGPSASGETDSGILYVSFGK